MDNSNRFIQWRKVSGDSIELDEATVTPMSQALAIRFPYGGIVWNRPVAIQVEDGTGLRLIQIVDVTLLVQLVIFGTGFLLTMLFWLVSHKSRK